MEIKICGITNPADARAAVDDGADLLGFVFFANSPRAVTAPTARAIIAGLPARVGKVGVFVNATVDQVREVATYCRLTAVQLHGDEAPDTAAALAEWRVLKAFALRSAADLERLAPFAAYTLVLDTPTPLHGGSGQTGDWALARQAAARHRVLLAGGLTPANVGAAIAAVRPAGVDVSSGVEAYKGRKDPAKLLAFIAAARAAAALPPAPASGGRAP